jgi:hypothetical protein
MNKNFVYWIILLIVLAVAGTGIYYKYQSTLPCAHPLPYAVGAIDPRFGVTSATLVADAEAAAAIWNTAAGKTVLTYDPNAAMKINLVYDSREAVAELGSEIAAQQANADAERAAIDALHTQFTSAQSSYDQEVTTINAHGGATKSQILALATERASLNALGDSVNAKVASYNADAEALNAVIQQYNQNAGHTFEEGEYVQDASGKRINVFEFIGTTQLERVLAHEFGHSLGLGHNSNPNSIMYAENESGNLVPTADDLSALDASCGLN